MKNTILQLLHSANRLPHPSHRPHETLKSGGVNWLMLDTPAGRLPFFLFIFHFSFLGNMLLWGKGGALTQRLQTGLYLYRLMMGLWYMHM